MSEAIPSPVPHGRTARRLEWAHLPPALRALVERRCGSPVVEAVSQQAGFTPGLAAVLVCADGSRHFVKAASVRAQRPFAAAYRQEALKLGALPPSVPAPRLRWSLADDDWVVLGIEYVEARAPHRPWRHADLERCLELTTRVATLLTPAAPDLAPDTFADLERCLELTTRVATLLTPAAPDLAPDTFAEDFADCPGHWEHVRAHRPDLPAPHVEEAAALAAGFAAVTAGATLVHTDIRDDNLLLCEDGRTLVCDWNFPVRGAAWLDTLLLLIGPRGDGLDVEALLSAHPLTRDVAPDHVDTVLALFCGYFLKSADDPAPSTSPHLRNHQRWYADVTWTWLAERRGWTAPASAPAPAI